MNGQLKWFKSKYSDDEGGNCVEVAFAAAIYVRDSKLPASSRSPRPPGRRSFPQFGPELEPRASSSSHGFLGFWAG
ncbi:DUF397 domain-containing protein [Streptomyces sp. NRRL S-646]|uniref:DUF397 domain-containing protein n=1 Tax=Streptomyces sp. NRRL S-646 TaxID=1463917 RepID=UPI000D14136C|nr:DUF397 domain-containing protein [Streptomyces sp. NRRL S-646]